ncbi:MAG TPA: DNA alkylation repair protein [Gemmataceae bacterium]|jgi:3-methyladenine DNA glycosylase AlkD|nr:DNA alkylation repair protein [Gemmataceae bacterium]
MRLDEVLGTLQSLASGKVRDGMQRFGIPVDDARGISTPVLKALARKLGKDHDLAAALWDTGIFEARAIAALVDEPDKVTRGQMDRWARAFNSWAICDACCCYLFRKTPFAWDRAVEWTTRKAEFVKRAGFSLMAYLAVHDKAAGDAAFEQFFPVIERGTDDDRPYVRKAVNWALRQIGKRNARLHARAIQVAEAMRARGTPSARWIAADALRELKSPGVRARLRLKDA